MATRGTIRLTNLQKGQIQAARIKARAKRGNSLDKRVATARRKSLNDIDEQRRRLLDSMTPEQMERFGNRVDDAAERYVGNIFNTKTYARDEKKSKEADDVYRKNPTKRNDMLASSAWGNLGDRKYSQRAYMGKNGG